MKSSDTVQTTKGVNYSLLHHSKYDIPTTLEM